MPAVSGRARLVLGARIGAWCAALALGIAAPFFLPSFTVHLLALILADAVWALSFGLVMGQVGLVSFGHAALFGGGAYGAAWVALNLTDALFAGLLAGGAVGLLLGVTTGIVLGRLNGVAYAIGTLAFGGMVARIANGWIDVTGGSDGLVGLPFPRAFGRVLDDRDLYWTILAIAVLSVIGMLLLLRHRVGAVLHAVRDSPARADASGIGVHAVRCGALGVAGIMAGLAGAVSSYLVGSVSPGSVDTVASGAVLVMAVIGGAETVAGPLLGALAYVLLEQVLSEVLPDYRLVLGALVMVIVLVAPRGFAGGLVRHGH